MTDSRNIYAQYHRTILTVGDVAILDAEINNFAGALARCFDSLSPAAQASAIALANSLGDLRMKIKSVEWEDKVIGGEEHK